MVDLKERHAIYIRVALLLSIVLNGVMLFAVPYFEPNVTPKTYEDIIIEDMEAPPEVEEPPPEERPALPVEAESEEEEEQAVETITETDFDPFDRIDRPIAPEPETPEFVAYDTPPMLIETIEPQYPDIARRAGIEGTVFVRVLVDVDGRVLDARIEKGINEALDRAAVDAAMRSRFSPAKQRDKPVRVWVTYPIRFTLKG
jgi:protein TonB